MPKKKAKEKAKKSPKEEQPKQKDGVAYVTFNASGPGTINPNPVKPKQINKKHVRVTWKMTPPQNTFNDWNVVFGNVIPCDIEDLLPGLCTQRSADGLDWEWTWEYQKGDSFNEEILYDVFFRYGPKIKQLSIRGRAMQTVSLRQILSVDPTIIMPPN